MSEAQTRSTTPSPARSTTRRLAALASLPLATGIWLPSLHLVFAPSGDRAARAPSLLDSQFRLWADPDVRAREVGRMRTANNEWDFMSRTFLVLALAERSLANPPMRERDLEVMDRVIDDTLRLEQEKGGEFFLMSYGRFKEFKVQPARSIFLDGEIAIMLGARRIIADDAAHKRTFTDRAAFLEERMRRGRVLCAESYPDECWTFCNTLALAALRFQDVLDGTDHRPFFKEWVACARANLVDPGTGILVSSFSLDGKTKDGPEGSSIWFSSHCLRLVDEAFARDQFARARARLARSALGFSWAREWPDGRHGLHGGMDVDSGPVVPIVEASAGSSGMAFIAASSFEDRELWDGLTTTLDFAAFPIADGSRRRYAASNQVGDAVLLYSMLQGPLWRKVGAP